jgi:DNA mismatch repair protein MutS2
LSIADDCPFCGLANAMFDLSLLYHHPCPRLDRLLGRQTLTFAFATGCGSDPFERLLSKQRSVPSCFSSDCFAPDLFLDAFVERCLATKLPGTERRFHLRSLRQALAAPPVSLADVTLRQGVFAELKTQPHVATACHEAWKAIDGLRVALESSEMSKRFDPIARRVEILRQLDQVVRKLADSFASSQSALRRIADFASAALTSPAYHHLEQLLDYDENLATLNVEVRIDRDGQIRTLAIVDQRENTDNPLYRNPLLRLWQRLSALFRGYSLRDREIIGRLIESVFDAIWLLILNLLELCLDLEFYLALDGFRALCDKRELDSCLPTIIAAGTAEPLRLEQVYNPFLLLEERRPVPCDLELRSNGLTLLTGPNSGGKTRLLQSIGFVQLLAQSGAWVPARAAQVPLRTGLFVSLVHESSADQHEGRLGTELLRIRRLFERLDYDQLVLLDELCSGTNPSEGEEIVELVISLLTELRPQAVITTHFLQFAGRLAQHPPVSGLSFLQVALDPHQAPLYQFVPGVATTSLAHLTAERIGVTREALQMLIRSKRNPVPELAQFRTSPQDANEQQRSRKVGE